MSHTADCTNENKFGSAGWRLSDRTYVQPGNIRRPREVQTRQYAGTHIVCSEPDSLVWLLERALLGSTQIATDLISN